MPLGRLLTSTVALAALTLTAACGSGSASSNNAGGGGSGGGSGTEVKVGVIPIVDTAPLYLGVKKGFFSDEGLDLKITATTGGAAAVPGVVSGSFDIAFGNVVSIMVAADKGLKLKFLTDGVSSSGKKPDFSAVLAPKGSSITSPKDLEGKTIGVNNLKNIGDTTIRDIVEKAGGDPKSLKFVEVAFPDAPAALERHQVDAAWVLEPFLSAAVAKGAKVITYNYVDFDPKLDIAGYFTKAENAGSKTSQAFAKAMNKSLQYAASHPDEIRKIVPTYTKIPADVAAKMALPTWRPDFDVASFTKLGDAAKKYGTVAKAPDVSALLPAQ